MLIIAHYFEGINILSDEIKFNKKFWINQRLVNNKQ